MRDPAIWEMELRGGVYDCPDCGYYPCRCDHSPDDDQLHDHWKDRNNV